MKKAETKKTAVKKETKKEVKTTKTTKKIAEKTKKVETKKPVKTAKKEVKKISKKTVEPKKTAKSTVKKTTKKVIEAPVVEERPTITLEVHDEILASLTTKGFYSSDIKRELDSQLTPKQYKQALKKQLEKHSVGGGKKDSKNPGDILWGKIIGYKPYEEKNIKNRFIIVALFEDVTVYIPDEWYFTKNYKFGLRYLTLNEEEKCNWRKFIIKQSFGAWVCFKITSVDEKMLGDEFEKQSVLWCIGNRLLALETLQDIYFFHKNRKADTDGEPIDVHIGQKVEAHIISVREDLVYVECLGVECQMDSISISNRLIDNCKEHYSPGDKMWVWIKSIETDENGDLKLMVSGRSNEINKQIGLIEVGSVFYGYVTKYSKKSDNYTVALPNDVKAIVSQNRVQGKVKLNYGDMVSVQIVEKYPKFVIGNAIKIR